MRWEWIHLVRMSNVMGNLELRRVGWDHLIPLNSREVCELIISGEGALCISLWKIWMPLR